MNNYIHIETKSVFINTDHIMAIEPHPGKGGGSLITLTSGKTYHSPERPIVIAQTVCHDDFERNAKPIKRIL